MVLASINEEGVTLGLATKLSQQYCDNLLRNATDRGAPKNLITNMRDNILAPVRNQWAVAYSVLPKGATGFKSIRSTTPQIICASTGCTDSLSRSRAAPRQKCYTLLCDRKLLTALRRCLASASWRPASWRTFGLIWGKSRLLAVAPPRVVTLPPPGPSEEQKLSRKRLSDTNDDVVVMAVAARSQKSVLDDDIALQPPLVAKPGTIDAWLKPANRATTMPQLPRAEARRAMLGGDKVAKPLSADERRSKSDALVNFARNRKALQPEKQETVADSRLGAQSSNPIVLDCDDDFAQPTTQRSNHLALGDDVDAELDNFKAADVAALGIARTNETAVVRTLKQQRISSIWNEVDLENSNSGPEPMSDDDDDDKNENVGDSF